MFVPMAPRSGFTLLEVLVALIVITVAVLGLAGTLGPIAALAGEGRARGRAALALESRLDRLRAELWAAPGCVPPGSGAALNPDGVREAWSARLSGGLVELTLTATAPTRGAVPDSLRTRIPCP